MMQKEDGLAIKHLTEDEVQLIERYKKLTNNFKWYILKSIDLCIEYQKNN